MTVQEFLRTLKTAKKVCPSTLSASSSLNNNSSQTPFKTLINSSSSSSETNINSFLTCLTSHKLHSFLSDPNVQTSDCLRLFNLVLHSQSYLNFKPGFHAHFTLICRLIKSRKFTDAEFLLHKLTLDPNYRYPFSEFADWVEKYCKESRIITKLLNMLLKMYSDNGMFDVASTVFDYMVENDIERDERTCSVHLFAMTKSDKIDLAFEFFRRMVDSGMEVSVFSMTIVVSGLCKIGELKMARELVEEMGGKGIRPNIITFNTLVDACARRWDLSELDVVLRMMEREGVEFNDATYRLLIEGYSSSGKIEKAEKLLSDMHASDIEVESYLYHIVVSGYCRLGSISSGLTLLGKMQERELSPTVDIYWSLVSGLCVVGEMGQAKKLVDEMLKIGGELDDDMFTMLADGYRNAGMLDEVAELQRTGKMKGSPAFASSQNYKIDFESRGELGMDDDAESLIADNLNEEKNGTLEELDVDDVLKAYLSSEKY